LAPASNASPLNLGFLTVVHEPTGYLGGYLVTNQWGRPLEFRLSTAVQPNRVQQVLYAATLQPYVCADLIGKTLLEKTGVPVQMVVTDTDAVLDLRLRVEVPVALIVPAADGADRRAPANALQVRGPIHCHIRFPEDVQAVGEVLDRVAGLLDPTEPFVRIREAIAEARKMGVSGRAA
jgi:hypothetical protein